MVLISVVVVVSNVVGQYDLTAEKFRERVELELQGDNNEQGKESWCYWGRSKWISCH